MTTPERARDLRAPVVEVAGVGMGNSVTGTHWSQQGAFTSTPQVFAAPVAFGMAGVGAGGGGGVARFGPLPIRAPVQDQGKGLCAQGGGGAFVGGARPG